MFGAKVQAREASKKHKRDSSHVANKIHSQEEDKRQLSDENITATRSKRRIVKPSNVVFDPISNKEARMVQKAIELSKLENVFSTPKRKSNVYKHLFYLYINMTSNEPHYSCSC